MSKQSDTELDDIMEDLMMGHNFEYARTALLAWRDRESEKKVWEARIEEVRWWRRTAIRQNLKTPNPIVHKALMKAFDRREAQLQDNQAKEQA